MEHTPGPWEDGALLSYLGLEKFIEENGAIPINMRGGMGFGHCGALVLSNVVGVDVAKANARLIAAAPDMLELIEKINNSESRGYDFADNVTEYLLIFFKAHPELESN